MTEGGSPLAIAKPKSDVGFAAPWSFILPWREERKHQMLSWPAPAIRKLRFALAGAKLDPVGLYSACVLPPDGEWRLIASTHVFDMATLRPDIVTIPALFNTVPRAFGNKVHTMQVAK